MKYQNAQIGYFISNYKLCCVTVLRNHYKSQVQDPTTINF